MALAIYKCRNKQCGNAWRIEYPEKHRYSVGYGRFATVVYRKDTINPNVRRLVGSVTLRGNPSPLQQRH